MKKKILIGAMSLFLVMDYSVFADDTLFSNINISETEKQEWLKEIGMLQDVLVRDKYLQLNGHNVSMYTYENVDYVFVNSNVNSMNLTQAILTANSPQNLNFTLSEQKMYFGKIQSYVLNGYNGIFIPIDALSDVFNITSNQN